MILTEDGTQAQNGQDTMLGRAKLHGQAVGSGGGGSGGSIRPFYNFVARASARFYSIAVRAAGNACERRVCDVGDVCAVCGT